MALKRKPDPKKSATPWFRREPIDLGEVAVEIVAVVLGVLIALAIDRWHQQNQDRKLVSEALRSVQAELTANRAEVLEQARHLQRSADAMASEATIEHGKPCLGYAGWRGVHSPMLLENAYVVAIATQALARMDFHHASLIGEAYGAQRFVGEIEDSVSTMLIDLNPRPRQLCVTLMRELASADEELANRYDRVLAALPDTEA